MFIGHGEIVAFLLYRLDADKPAPLLLLRILALYYTSCYQRRPLLGTPRSRDIEKWLWSSFRHYTYGEPGPVLVNETQRRSFTSAKSRDPLGIAAHP